VAAYHTRLQALPRRVRRALQRRLGLPLGTLALWLALGQLPALAATITVGGACTLVDAITAANTDAATGGCPAGSRADTIVLPPGSTQTLTTIHNDIYGPTGLPVVSSVVTIAGQGSTIARDSRAPAFRLLAVNSTGDLTLQETTVSGGDGGGVANFGGTLTITNSTISGNTITGYGIYYPNRGGGVYNFGTLTIRDSTIAGNTAGVGAGGGVGNVGTLTITDSTIAGNTAGVGGGVDNTGGSALITNSTIAGNTVSYGGGGVLNRAYCDPLPPHNCTPGTVIITNSTIAGNTADTRDGGVANSAADFRSDLTLIRTLVSGNTAPVTPEVFNDGVIVADNHNLFGVNGSAGVDGFTPGPTDVVPPRGVWLSDILDPTLADNGGPTQTLALVPGSPAIDAGGPVCLDANGDPLTTDQRGQPRPVDGNGDGLAACDIGAIEFQSPAVLTVTIDIKPGSAPNSINPKSRGVIPVAILTTDAFGATTVDPLSVRFGPHGATEAHHKGHIEDINHDGEPDLVLHFQTQATGIQCGDTSAALIGETFDGEPIQGSDSIKTVGCKK
jgi:hypothetical protein